MRSLRIRFAIVFSILISLILGSALVAIYFLFADFTREEFYNRLKDRALTTFKLLVEVDEVNIELLQLIDKNTLSSLYDEKVFVLQNDSVIYRTTKDVDFTLDPHTIQDAKLDSILYLKVGSQDQIIMNIKYADNEYMLVASAYDKYGRSKLNFLKWMMIIVYCSGLLVSWVVTYLFVKTLIRPLDTLNSKIDEIHSENLHMRLPVEGRVKEVDRLAMNFNGMLERLQQTFGFQKDFVHYASHELRTPLTAMIGITENALSKDMSPNEYKVVLKQLFQLQQDLAGITNSLLLLSNKNSDRATYPEIRLDELLFRSIEIIRSLHPEAEIELNLQGDLANEEEMMVNANEPLILIAINNLIKNAVQYSEEGSAVKVFLRTVSNVREIEIRNCGYQIEPSELKQLFTPFYRGQNASGIKGHGLGLPLVKQIADLNGATVEYFREDHYNVFKFSFGKN